MALLFHISSSNHTTSLLSGKQSPPHTSFYPWDWLKRNSYDPPIVKPSTIGAGARDRCILLASRWLIFYSFISYRLGSQILWNSNIHKNPPTVAFEDVMKDEGDVLNWLEKIVRLGFPPIQRSHATPLSRTSSASASSQAFRPPPKPRPS